MVRYIDITGPNTILIDTDPAFTSQNLEVIRKDSIIHVGGVFNQKPVTATQEEWGYPTPTMTRLTLQLHEGLRFEMELQDVANQPTWDGGTAADLNQAIADINASL
jgi:hypothetical protein